MIRLYIDTETTGLPDREKPESEQPWLTEVGALLIDEERGEAGHEIARLDTLVSPDSEGWECPPATVALNGITTLMCQAHGLPLAVIIPQLWTLAVIADEIVVQNWDFESQMLFLSFGRALALHRFAIFGERVVRDCTVIGKAVFPELPLSRHGFGPSQRAIYRQLYGRDPDRQTAHRAMADVGVLRQNLLGLDAVMRLRAEEKAGHPLSESPATVTLDGRAHGDAGGGLGGTPPANPDPSPGGSAPAESVVTVPGTESNTAKAGSSVTGPAKSGDVCHGEEVRL